MLDGNECILYCILRALYVMKSRIECKRRLLVSFETVFASRFFISIHRVLDSG